MDLSWPSSVRSADGEDVVEILWWRCGAVAVLLKVAGESRGEIHGSRDGVEEQKFAGGSV